MANWAGNKTKHVLSQVWLGLKRGAQIGAVVGVAFGVGSLIMGAAAFTLPALAGYAIMGGVVGSLFGMNTGGFVGGIKGLLTRAHPDGEALIKEAEAECGSPAPQQPPIEKPCNTPQVAPQQPQIPAVPPQQPQPLQTAPQQPATPCVDKQQTLAELKAMTEALTQSQEKECPPSQQPAAAQPQSWQAREQQNAQQAAMTSRQR